MYARMRTQLYIILNTARYFRGIFGVNRKAGEPFYSRGIYLWRINIYFDLLFGIQHHCVGGDARRDSDNSGCTRVRVHSYI